MPHNRYIIGLLQVEVFWIVMQCSVVVGY